MYFLSICIACEDFFWHNKYSIEYWVVIGRVLRNPGGENVVENDNSNNY